MNDFEKSKIFAGAIFNNDIEKIKELTNDTELTNDLDVYYVFVVAIQKANDELLEILYSKLSIERFISRICENDDLERMMFSIEYNRKFKQTILNNFQRPLQICGKFNSVRVCKYLLLLKYDAKSKKIIVESELSGGGGGGGSTSNYCTLHIPCHFSNIEIVQLLCDDINTDVNQRNSMDQSALHICCWNDVNLEIVKVLVEAAIDVNMVDQFGCTALSNACLGNAYYIVQYLLSQKNQLNLNVDDTDPVICKYKIEHPDLEF